MTYYGGKELARSFRTVRDNTIQIAEEVPEQQYDFRAAAGTRTIGQTLVHMAVAPNIALHIQGNRVTDLKAVNFPELMQKAGADEARPRTKTEIIALLKTEGEKFASYLEGLSESFLAEQVASRPGMDPAFRTRFEMLLSSKEHEMHHRAQLMTLQRMIGIVPHLTRRMQERMARAQGAPQGR